VQFETFALAEDPVVRGCDATAEFLPHFVYSTLTSAGKTPIDDHHRCNLIYRYDDLAEVQLVREMPRWRRYQCVVPNWDNTPRKPQGSAVLFLGSTPECYERWLTGAIAQARAERHEFVLVNAWNEWAEGAHLEPDLRYGRAYLEATARAVGVDPGRFDLTAAQCPPQDIRANVLDANHLRQRYDGADASSATAIESLGVGHLDTIALRRQVRALEDALRERTAVAPSDAEHVNLSDPISRLNATRQRLSVRAAKAFGRVPIAGRVVRMLAILRRDWRSL
jgi:hypothetical protein